MVIHRFSVALTGQSTINIFFGYKAVAPMGHGTLFGVSLSVVNKIMSSGA